MSHNSQENSAVTVLIANASPFIRMLLRYVLEAAGCVVVAETGDAGSSMQLYREHQPAVVLLGCKFSDRTGIETATAIVNHDPEAFIVICCFEVPKRELLTEAGISGLLPMPFNAGQLLESISPVTAKTGNRPAHCRQHRHHVIAP